MFVFSGLDWVVHCQLFGEQSRVGSMKIDPSSGAGMNLKVGGGHRSGAKVRGTNHARSAVNCFWSYPPLFLALKVQLGLVVLVSAFVMVSTV